MTCETIHFFKTDLDSKETDIVSPYKTMQQTQSKLTSWREREVARRTAADDAERRKKTEVTPTNFPTLTPDHPVQTSLVSGTAFAELATKWATESDSDRRLAEYRKTHDTSERRHYETVYPVRSPARSNAYYDEDNYGYEEDAPPTPAPSAVGSGAPDNDSGWIEVKNKVRKPKRELSIAQMEARDRQRGSEDEDAEFNAELYAPKRHDHDRV